MHELEAEFDVVAVEWRVLVAAPSAPHRAQLIDCLRRYPMKIDVTEMDEGGDILAALTANAYNIAFIDTDFPELAGLDALKRAREGGSTTFVALTASRANSEVIDIAKALRAYDYLVRPLNSAAIFKTLDNYAQLSRPLRLLIIDDSATVRTLVKRVLDHSVFTIAVLEAGDGVTAFEMFAREAPDLVLLDINMPGLDGYDTLRLLRAHNRNARVAIMSSHPVDMARVEHVEVLQKPFGRWEVDHVMHRLLGMAEPFG